MKFGLGNPWTWLQNYYGGPEIFALKTQLFALPFDFSVDIGTASSHIYKGNWFEGILTCLIVILSGLIISIGFLWSKTDRPFILSEARRAGLIWVFLLVFPPGLLPFVFTKLLLNYMIEVRDSDPETAGEMEGDEKMIKLKDLNLKANWCEAVFEGKYQSLLQIIILLEPGTTFNNFLEIFPILTTIKETYSHTMGVYRLAEDHFQRERKMNDPTPKMSVLYGFAYNGISILAPALCISGTRQWLHSSSDLTKFLATIAAFAVYYTLFSMVYLFCLFISNITSKIKFYIIFHLTTILLYSGCLYFWLSISMDTCQRQSISGVNGDGSGSGGITLATCDRNMYYIVVPIFICLSVLSLVTPYLCREFAQFALQIMNDKINGRWWRIKGYILLRS